MSKMVLNLFALMLITLVAEAQNSISHGTLNLVLANKNGVVIATDSRSSSGFNCSDHEDNSVKLFKTSDQSAMAIAGFASSYLDIPFGMKVAGVIGRHFDPVYDASPALLNDWLDVQIFPDIEGLAALVETAVQLSPGGRPTGAHFDFIATTADIFAKGVPHISQSKFVQTDNLVIGPLGNSYPTFELKRDEIAVQHFVYKTAGMPQFIEPILKGNATGDDDPVVKKYLAALRRGTRDNLSLSDLAGLAHRLLAITSKNTPCVGGPDQIAVLPFKGKSSWTLMDARTIYSQLEGKRFALGSTFDAGRRDKPSKEVFPDHGERVNQWTYVMLNNRVKDSRVWLDGNLFLGNLFINPTFVWNGNLFQLPLLENKLEGTCKIQVGPNALGQTVPAEFADCEKAVAPPEPPFEAVGYPTPLVVMPLSELLKKERQ